MNDQWSLTDPDDCHYQGLQMPSKDSCEKSSDVIVAAGRKRTDFEHGSILEARRMGHFISKIIWDFSIFRSTMSRVCPEYITRGITSHHGQSNFGPHLLSNRYKRLLHRAVSITRQARLY
ncbi:retrovirus-related Pol polyprotein from transposon 412 [Trichonephila clavipes]|nr:retrovirus-related Pol polyprotein from transposon 412 [Trichonephila clavipes]